MKPYTQSGNAGINRLGRLPHGQSGMGPVEIHALLWGMSWYELRVVCRGNVMTENPPIGPGPARREIPIFKFRETYP